MSFCKKGFFRCLVLGLVACQLQACSRGNSESRANQSPEDQAGASNDTNSEKQGTQTESQMDDLIIGGRTATRKDEVTFTTVSLIDTEQGSLCTASILSETIAVTAAHCVEGRVEAMKLSFGINVSKNRFRQVQEVAVPELWQRKNHHGYDESVRDVNLDAEHDTGDIALVKFSGGLPPGYRPAAVMGNHKLVDGETVTLAGYGITNGSRDTGAGRLRLVDTQIKNANFSRSEVSIDQSHGKGACHGDSGGPAFITSPNGGYQLWGITSRGQGGPPDDCNGFAIYTKIKSYSKWINSVAKAWR